MLASKILVMGLPGSGKTTLAGELKKYLEENSNVNNMPGWHYADVDVMPKTFTAIVDWFNADIIRTKFNDWDFSNEGRIRQSIRMAKFALECTGDYVICDFIAPLPEMRENFNADWIIWLDTIGEGRYDDTNKAFIPPTDYDFRITEKNAVKWAAYIGDRILECRHNSL